MLAIRAAEMTSNRGINAQQQRQRCILLNPQSVIHGQRFGFWPLGYLNVSPLGPSLGKFTARGSQVTTYGTMPKVAVFPQGIAYIHALMGVSDIAPVPDGLLVTIRISWCRSTTTYIHICC